MDTSSSADSYFCLNTSNFFKFKALKLAFFTFQFFAECSTENYDEEFLPSKLGIFPLFRIVIIVK